jgi:hypothetical protein
VDEELIIGSMVKALRARPGEWLTFAYMSSAIDIPNCDANIVGAMADYRPDLFAVSNDKRLKLRAEIVEDVARQGISWRVPERPAQVRLGSFDRHGGTQTAPTPNGCYCSLSDEEILIALKDASVPDEALVFSCCWKNICRVRGLFFNLVPADAWTEICRRRGYIQRRENPRGF